MQSFSNHRAYLKHSEAFLAFLSRNFSEPCKVLSNCSAMILSPLMLPVAPQLGGRRVASIDLSDKASRALVTKFEQKSSSQLEHAKEKHFGRMAPQSTSVVHFLTVVNGDPKDLLSAG
eukprot:3581582-Pleurochrysis_carterae.AAC.3